MNRGTRVVALALLAGCAGPAPRRADPAFATGDWDVTRPRGTPREVDFTTDEGTWMSVDVGPDGRSLVFDLLAHVYRVDAAGGTAACLTQDSGVATNFHPRWSPDGRSIAFISDRAGQNNLWVMDADGSRPRLVHRDLESRHAEPAWAPDGRHLYATRFFPNRRGGWTKAAEIWRFPLEGGEPVKLLGTRETQVWTPCPSPDGRFLYYHEATEPIVSADGYYKISDHHHLRRLDLASGATEQVTDADRRKYFRALPLYDASPALAPDGRRLAFVRNVPQARLEHRGHVTDRQTGLWIRDLDSGAERLLMHPLTPDQFRLHSMFHQKFVPGLAWAPDGASIFLSQGGKLRRVDVASGAVSTLPFQARVRRTISQQNKPRRPVDLEPFEIRCPRWPAVSPDGASLAFEAVGRLWLKKLPDGPPSRLTRDESDRAEMSPAWSPDGAHLAFATWDDAEGGQLWRLAAEGGTPERLTEKPGEYLNPAWSPDGRSLVAIRGAGALARGLEMADNGWFDLVRLPASGGPATVLHRIAPPAGQTQFARPFFGPGGRICFTEGSVLASVGPDGADRREHGRFTLSEDARISPDGEWIAFHEAHHIWAAPFRDRSDFSAAARKIAGDAGRYPEWGRDGRLRFLSADRLVTVDVRTGASSSVELGLRVPSDFARGTIAFTGARIITGRELQVIERGNVLVRDGRLVGVGNVDVAGADRVVDATGKTIIPGLVDVHAHNHAYSPELQRPHHAPSAKFLAYGVTTAHDPAGRTNLTLPLGERIRAGSVLGPRLFSAAKPLYSWGEDRQEIRSAEDAGENVRRLASEGALSIKQYFQINRFQRQWIAEEARKVGNLLVTGEGMDLHYVLSTLMDGQTANEHPITQFPYQRDLIEFFAQTGSCYSPTLVTPGGGHQMLEYYMARSDLPNDPRERNFLHWREAFRQTTPARHPISEYSSALVFAAIRQFYDRGVVMGLGGHGEVPGRSTHWDLWLYGLALRPLEAIHVGTLLGARYLGVDHDLGSLEPGKIADLVVLDADPVEDLKNTLKARWVMKGGRLFEALTLDEVWPRQRPFGPRPWRNEEVEKAAGLRADTHHDR
jgi:Tol biopolymer transport system component